MAKSSIALALTFSLVLTMVSVCSTVHAQAFTGQQQPAATQPATTHPSQSGVLQPIQNATGVQLPATAQQPSSQARPLQAIPAPSQIAPAQVVPTQLVPTQGAATQSAVTQGTANQESTTAETESVETFQLSGRFHLVDGSQQGYLILKAAIPDGSYIYSLTNAEGPSASTIVVAPGESFRTGENFESDRHPYVVEHDEVFGCRLEKHYKLVQFFIPIEVAAGVEPQTIRPEMTFNGQICSDEGFCMPLHDKKVAAEFGGYFQPQVSDAGAQTESRR